MRVELRSPCHSGQPRCDTARGLLAPRVLERLPEPPAAAGVPAPDLSAITNWSADAQERALDLLRKRELRPWAPFYCPRPNCDGQPHGDWSWAHARADQRPPRFNFEWLVWLLAGGRGSGKTRTGAEATHRMAKKHPRLHLISPTGTDLRETMVEGESGILATASPDFMPEWEPSKKKLTWPNGSIALGFSGEEPDRLRGPQCYWVWIDEPAHMPLIGGEYGVWDNMLFGLRLKHHNDPRPSLRPWVCATTTPKPNVWMKELVKDEDTVVVKVSTYANLSNLSDVYRKIIRKYEGTRVGRQELYAELLEDVEGALWKLAYITYIDTKDTPEHFDRILVGVDPAGTKNKRSDETGIVVVGIVGETIYVLADYTDKYSPSEWATTAHDAYDRWSADALVAEKNYGGDMVREVIEKNTPKGQIKPRILDVTSRRGKALRAEPIVALYEKTMKMPAKPRILHVKTATPTLEDEMLNWVPGVGDSPNRVDAMVHAATLIAGDDSGPASVGDPTTVKMNIPQPASALR